MSIQHLQEKKKQLLIEAFDDLCDEVKHKSLTLEIRMIIKNFVNQDLETVIDSVIQLSKGNFQINQKQQKLIIKCLLQLCQCMSKKKKLEDLNLLKLKIFKINNQPNVFSDE